MGRGLVKAPRDESVPARKVFDTPFRASLKNRETGSIRPGAVAENRRREMSVCAVRALLVSWDGSQRRR